MCTVFPFLQSVLRAKIRFKTREPIYELKRGEECRSSLGQDRLRCNPFQSTLGGPLRTRLYIFLSLLSYRIVATEKGKKDGACFYVTDFGVVGRVMVLHCFVLLFSGCRSVRATECRY